MSLTTKFRNKLEKKVFGTGKLASDATFYEKSTVAYNERGEEIGTTETGTTIRFVPFNLIAGRVNYVPFGDMEEADTDAVVPYDTTVFIKQKVSFQGIDYEIKYFENYVVESNIVGIALRLAKIKA